jgi:hypothetical protein
MVYRGTNFAAYGGAVVVLSPPHLLHPIPLAMSKKFAVICGTFTESSMPAPNAPPAFDFRKLFTLTCSPIVVTNFFALFDNS